MFAAVFAAGEDGRLPTFISLLEDVAQGAPAHRVGAQALAVGRIDQDDLLPLDLAKGLRAML